MKSLLMNSFCLLSMLFVMGMWNMVQAQVSLKGKDIPSIVPTIKSVGASKQSIGTPNKSTELPNAYQKNQDLSFAIPNSYRPEVDLSTQIPNAYNAEESLVPRTLRTPVEIKPLSPVK